MQNTKDKIFVSLTESNVSHFFGFPLLHEELTKLLPKNDIPSKVNIVNLGFI